MKEWISSPFFGLTLTIAAYAAGAWIQRKTGKILCNSVLIAVVLLIAVLLLGGISYEDYYVGASLIHMLLLPATVCMAVPIYHKRKLLKKYWVPVLAGCLAGAVTSVLSVWVLSRLFGLDQVMTASFLPKSVTTPIAIAISESHGGIPSITAAMVLASGILGNLLAPVLIRVFRVRSPFAAGLGIGACSHGIGTAKALEIGETEGAMSGLAIGLCGILTAVLALGFGYLL